jgi:hypothetical protein
MTSAGSGPDSATNAIEACAISIAQVSPGGGIDGQRDSLHRSAPRLGGGVLQRRAF